MRYINQLEHEEIPYVTDTQHPDSKFAVSGSVKIAGCGICSACMMVDRLTTETLSLEDCIGMSYAAEANQEPGTDMKRLGPALAERFRLSLTMTDDVDLLKHCLQAGGCCIVNVGGDREGHTGVFSRGGHYILAVSWADGVFRLLDPSDRPDKYEGTPVRHAGHFLLAEEAVLLADTANRSPAFYLFMPEAPRD